MIRLNAACGLNYASLGDSGEPLVLLHGLTRRWQSFLPVMQSLSMSNSVFAADHIGHGQSARAPRYRVTDYVGPVAEWLRTAIARPAILYGHSLGSMVAAAIAASAPELVKAVILEDPPFETMGSRLPGSALHSYFSAIQPFAGSVLPVDELAAQLAEARAMDASGGMVPLSRMRDAVALRFSAASLKRLDPAVLAPVITGGWLAGYDVEAVMSAIRCPALLLQSDPANGAMLTDEDAATAKRLIKDCTVVRVTGAPHLIHSSDAQALLRLVHGFLACLD